MKLTPIDIRKWEFKKGVRGYDKQEVKAFLELTSEEFEKILQEKRDFEQRCKRLDADIEEYKRVEKSLQDTLISAKETTDRSMENSRKEAELIVSDAELRADKILVEARKKASRIEDEITRLKVQRDAFVSRLRNILQSQIELVTLMGEEEVDDFRLSRPREKVTEPPQKPAAEPAPAKRPVMPAKPPEGKEQPVKPKPAEAPAEGKNINNLVEGKPS